MEERGEVATKKHRAGVRVWRAFNVCSVFWNLAKKYNITEGLSFRVKVRRARARWFVKEVIWKPNAGWI